MPLLRLIVACVLAVALPLQGLAAVAMLGCDAGPAGGTLSAPGAQADAHQGHARPAEAHPGINGAAVRVGSAHSGCAACASACCHAVALPVPLVAAAQRLPVPAEPLPALLHYASWTEPVPHKPPRS